LKQWGLLLPAIWRIRLRRRLPDLGSKPNFAIEDASVPTRALFTGYANIIQAKCRGYRAVYNCDA
jgi:hypothetical protein